jgi:hypothetical protein
MVMAIFAVDIRHLQYDYLSYFTDNSLNCQPFYNLLTPWPLGHAQRRIMMREQLFERQPTNSPRRRLLRVGCSGGVRNLCFIGKPNIRQKLFRPWEVPSDNFIFPVI